MGRKPPKARQNAPKPSGRESPCLRPIFAALALAVLAGLPFSSVRAPEPDTQIITPSTQTLTSFTQTGGTFDACAANIDGTTCDYQEGDAGDGETHNTLKLPTANGGTNQFAAVGCTEANEYQCVDEGVSHDSDTTYIWADGAPVGPTISNFAVADCLPADCAMTGTTILSGTGWAYARFVAGAAADPTLGVLIFCAGSTARSITPTESYLNYSTTAQTGCDSLAEVNAATVQVEYDDPPLGDVGRFTAAGLTISYRHPNWRGTVQYDFTAVKKLPTADSVLTIRMAVASGETWVCDVFDWLSNSYDASVLSFTSTSQTEAVYDLIENDHVSSTGGVRLRCVDGNQAADETQGTISIDSAFIRTLYTEETTYGGGNLGELLMITCEPGLFRTPCRFDLSPLAIGVGIEQTQWYVDGLFIGAGQAVSGNRHVQVLEGFRLRETENVTVLAFFTNGQSFEKSKLVVIDNSWVAFVILLGSIAIIALVSLRVLARRARSADRHERSRGQAASANEAWRENLWNGKW